MSSHRVARRYAVALLDSAQEAKNTAAVAADLRMIRDLTRQSKEFAAFLRSPVIKRDRKTDILAAIFGTKVQPMTSELLRLLAEKGREEYLPEVIDTFFRLEDEREGLLTVAVRSAAELTPDQSAQLARRFEALSKKKIRLAPSVDPSLKAGFVARVGDTVYDGSIARQLELLRKRITEETAFS